MELQFGAVGTGCCCQSPKACWAFELPLFSLFPPLSLHTPAPHPHLSVSLFLSRTGVAANQLLILALRGAVTLHCGKFWTSWQKLERIRTLMLWHKISVHPYEQACQDREPFKRVLFYSFPEFLNGLEWQPRTAQLDKHGHLLSFLFWFIYLFFFFLERYVVMLSVVSHGSGALWGLFKVKAKNKSYYPRRDMCNMSSYFMMHT